MATKEATKVATKEATKEALLTLIDHTTINLRDISNDTFLPLEKKNSLSFFAVESRAHKI